MTDHVDHIGNVHIFPGVNRPDLQPELPVQMVLREAGTDALIEAVVVGRGVDGNIRIRATGGDVDRVMALMMRAIHFLAGHQPGPPIQPQPEPEKHA